MKEKYNDNEETSLVIYGRNAVLEAFRSDRTIDRLYVQEGVADGTLQSILRAAKKTDIIISFVSKDRLNKYAEGDKHQGVVAMAAAYSYAEVDDILNAASKKGEPPFIIVLDDIEDPHNLGAIIRTANQAGAHGVIIPKRHAVGLTATVARTSAGAINYTPVAKVTNISRTIDELKENEAHFKTMFYYSGEAIFLIKDNKIADINKSGLKMLGYHNSEEVIGREFSDFVMELKRSGDDRTEDDIDEVFARVAEGETIKKEMRIETKNLTNVHIEAFMIDLKTPNNEFIYMSARDISIRKVRENEILQKSRYDELTNVANRKYFNEVTGKMIQIPESYPICYLMADINGLKLTNDVFGHAKGDELIVKIASVLSSCCRNSDIVARIGGDEFAILFTNTDAGMAASLVDRINKKLDRQDYDSVKPSVSMGYAVKKSIDDGVEFDSIVKSADAMMYINKSASREQTRKIFLDNMLDKLYEISPDEVVRYKELRIMAEKIGKMYSFEPVVEKKINNLITYVNVGKLITPRIEWEMKGENISTLRFSRKLLENTAVILNIISNSINNIVTTEELFLLNENWDGSGEKYNTLGDEIPLEVRVFRMIYDIYYLKTHKEIVGILSNDEIIALIRSESGKRYDPRLCECRWEEIL